MYTIGINEAQRYINNFYNKGGPGLEPGKCHRLIAFKSCKADDSGIFQTVYTYEEVNPAELAQDHRVESMSPPGSSTMLPPVEDKTPEDLDELKRKAYHESGHALLMVLGGRGIDRIRIQPDIGFVDPGKGAMRDGWVCVEVVMAGEIAQGIFTGREPLEKEVKDDRDRAGDIIRRAAPLQFAEIHAKLKERTENAVQANWASIDALAHAIIALKRRGGAREMSGEKAEQIIKQHLAEKDG